MRLVGTFLDREIIDSIQSTGVHPDLGLKVNPGVTAYQLEQAEEAFDGADVVMCGVNSFGIEWAGEHLARLMKPGQKLLTVTKGMRADDDGTMRILPDVLRSYFDPELAESVSWNAIVGPSIAGELAVHHDTCVVFCGQDQDDLDYLAARTTTTGGRPRTSSGTRRAPLRRTSTLSPQASPRGCCARRARRTTATSCTTTARPSSPRGRRS